MARPKRHDPKSLDERETELRAELKRLRLQRRAAAEAARQARLVRVSELVEKFRLDQLSDTVLASEFKALAAKHLDAPESADTGDGEARTQPAEPTSPAPTETAQVGSGLRKLFGGG